MSYIERELLLIGVDGCISSLHAQAKGEPIQEVAIKLVETTRDYIASLSAADVAPVRHGRWIELSRSSKCSECEFETGRYEPARKFCPACGALMDGEETPTCHDGVCDIPGVIVQDEATEFTRDQWNWLLGRFTREE